MKAEECLDDARKFNRLDSLARLAEDVGDHEMGASVGAAERIKSAGLAGRMASRDDIARLSLLIEWQRRRL